VIVVDTSVLIDMFRGKDTAAVEHLVRLERESTPFHIPALCCQELLQGAKNEREWKLLLEYLSSQQVLLPADPWHTHVEAARIFFDCRRKGLTVRSAVDCFIAQLALENEAILLHDDEDFTRICRVRPLGTLPGTLAGAT